MAKAPQRTAITLSSLHEGAYRVNIVGENPADVATILVTGRQSTSEVALAPGYYSVLVEDLSRATKRTVPLHLSGRDRAVTVDLDGKAEALFKPGSWRPSRPSRRQADLRSGTSASGSTKAVNPNTPPETGVRARLLTIGLSVDTQPDRRGGWRPAYIPATFPVSDTDGVLVIEFDQPNDWRQRAKWRLTVAVEDDSACQVPLPLFRDGLRVEMSVVDTPTGPDVAVMMLPKSARVAGLVGGLRRNVRGDPTRLVEWSADSNIDNAVGVLAEKMADPWAAAAAALLLVRSGQIEPVAHWAQNLANQFPWLADAGVVAAWAHAATTDDDEEAVENACLQRLIDARKRGSLYFTASNTLAIEMLTTMVSGGKGANIASRAHKELLNWARWTRRLVRGGAFVSWEENGQKLSSGLLPANTYAILATGSVTAGRIVATPDRNWPRLLFAPHGVSLGALHFAGTFSDGQRRVRALAPPPIETFDPPAKFQLSHDGQDDVWALREADSGRKVTVFDTKSEAVAAGQLRAALGEQGGAVSIYSRDGRIQEERTFSKKSEY